MSGRAMVDDVHIVDRASHYGSVARVASDRILNLAQVQAPLPLIAIERANRLALFRQVIDQVPADKPGRAGNERSHDLNAVRPAHSIQSTDLEV